MATMSPAAPKQKYRDDVLAAIAYVASVASQATPTRGGRRRKA